MVRQAGSGSGARAKRSVFVATLLGATSNEIAENGKRFKLAKQAIGRFAALAAALLVAWNCLGVIFTGRTGCPAAAQAEELGSPASQPAAAEAAAGAPSGSEFAAALPPGVAPVWDAQLAWRETTATRERMCINGLWRFQPAEPDAAEPPAARWGFFKVPGPWPGITSYIQKDSQTLYRHPAWADTDLRRLSTAWYQREVSIPRDWSGRRILLALEQVNSLAAVFIDGRRAGEVRFPGGDLDISDHCRPGATHTVSLLVTALPLRGVMLSYTDTAAAREVKGSVERRGLCGDLFLVAVPSGPRLGPVRVSTSYRNGEVTIEAQLEGERPTQPVMLRAAVRDGSRQDGGEAGRIEAEFAGRAVPPAELEGGTLSLTARWRPERLWDIHTPNHQYVAEVELADAAGRRIDAAFPVRFGFREFWIDGRDFRLNGSRIWLSAVPLDSAQLGAAWAGYESAKETLLRLKSFGINFVYTHHYSCEPGTHLAMEEILRAADDTGMLVALTQPHFSHYDWKSADAERTNGYADHAAYYARVAGSHPSVVAYATSHNATASGEDMNPDWMGIEGVRRESWSAENTKRAFRAEALIRRADPSRIVYHHAGDIGVLHASNFYPNFVPIQEMSDWFETWAARGVKPVFLCEYGAPFSWDWAMYRGWFKGKREFGSAAVPWEFCLAEWNAQFLGDAAYRISPAEKTNLRWEAKQARSREGWHRWDYPHQLGSNQLTERDEVFFRYTTDNWRAFRTWGLSANSPWEHNMLFRLRDGVDKSRRNLPVDWQRLQRPGFSADFIDDRYERMDLAFDRDDWIATGYGRAILRNNMPLLAYLAGGPERFTAKDHNYLPGETVEKQIIVINNARVPVVWAYRWTTSAPGVAGGSGRGKTPTGEQARVPISFKLPGDIPPGAYRIALSVEFSAGETQQDEFEFHVLPPPPTIRAPGRTAVFDPKGETVRALESLGVRATPIAADADLSAFDLLLVGKGALGVNTPAPDLSAVRRGLRVVVFEQSAEALEKRLGFRVVEYGLRQVFPRVPDHPVLAGLGHDAAAARFVLSAEHLRDWRGAATLLPPRLTYKTRPMHGPTVSWCGLPVTRLWRCGNQGAVASVLIEKPARGDFLPIVDGGYSLQYSPLLEYREGKGMVLFCQLDVTGRTAADPAADRLLRQMLDYAAQWKPPVRRTVAYAGDPAGKQFLSQLGISAEDFTGQQAGDVLLVAGPGSAAVLQPHRTALADHLTRGGPMLAVALDQRDAQALPVEIPLRRGEYISQYFEPAGIRSPLAGVGPADAHNRDPRELPLLPQGQALGTLAEGKVVVCQLAPWQFSPQGLPTRRTFRRTSCLLSRLLGNLGASPSTPLLRWFGEPADGGRSAPELLTNADFARDADGDGLADAWQLSAEPSPRCAREQLADGAWAQRFTLPTAAAGKAPNLMIAQHDIPMRRGQWYKITVKAKAEGMDNARVQVAVQNTANWKPLFDYQQFTPTNQWQTFEFVVESNADVPKGAKFQLWHSSPGVLWLSLASIKPCPPPTQGRWLESYYLDTPEEWDDPYRFFRW